MFEFRQEHFEQMSADRLRDFESRVADHLQVSNPECCVLLGDEALKKHISASVKKAFSYHISRELNVVQFVRIELEEGPDFELAPQCTNLLTLLQDASIEETQKIERLWDAVEAMFEVDPNTNAPQEIGTSELDEEDQDLQLTGGHSDDEDDDFDLDVEDDFDFEDMPSEWQ